MESPVPPERSQAEIEFPAPSSMDAIAAALKVRSPVVRRMGGSCECS